MRWAAIILAALAAASAVNQFVAYYPTAGDLYAAVAGTPQLEQTQLSALGSVSPDTTTGRVVPVTIPATFSQFQHREEYVYLPPAWFRGHDHPHLPAIELIGGVLNHPDDWIRAGQAVASADSYAAAHGGWAPILVFADPSGGFGPDTECVDGPRGNAETHLARDIPAYVDHTFGATRWGVAGWSMGGTCALDLSLRHPDVFPSFLDISGDVGPNLGSRASTIQYLYGGDAAAWAAHDPRTVLAAHRGPWRVHGVFAAGVAEPAHIGPARMLAAAASRAGLDAGVHVEPGAHSWSFAARMFGQQLPWFAGQLQGPDQATVMPTFRSGRPG
ncbi:alpha/beta hydrolase-fold protein [Saccharomonospora sp. NPDC046836]|uniref:alpha/beta hydrolase n=1 Tax=Saccharomonospora sp. NPDC046836 TaxID=3156921 RepID=UPI003406EB8D